MNDEQHECIYHGYTINVRFKAEGWVLRVRVPGALMAVCHWSSFYPSSGHAFLEGRSWVDGQMFYCS